MSGIRYVSVLYSPVVVKRSHSLIIPRGNLTWVGPEKNTSPSNNGYWQMTSRHFTNSAVQTALRTMTSEFNAKRVSFH